MNKSLAERIGERTRKVIAAREAEERESNRVKVRSALAKEITSKARDGKSIFLNKEENELNFDLYSFNEMSSEEVKIALQDIGFEIHSYAFRSVPAIPQENVSNEIQELLEMYYVILNDFKNTERAKAERACTAVLKKLEEGEYEIVGIDRVTVDFIPISCSEQYKIYVREMMAEQGFTIDTIDTHECLCYISIIHNGGD